MTSGRVLHQTLDAEARCRAVADADLDPGDGAEVAQRAVGGAVRPRAAAVEAVRRAVGVREPRVGGTVESHASAQVDRVRDGGA